MKKIIIYGVLIFQVMLIYSLIRSIQLAVKARSRVTDLEEKKTALVEKQRKLADELSYVQSDYYVEKVARDELQLAKPGETVVLVPDGSVMGTQETTPQAKETPRANWQKWLDVVSGKIN